MVNENYRVIWTQSSAEINYPHFDEGRGVCNHIENSAKVFAGKFVLFDIQQTLDEKLKAGTIKSTLFSSARDFMPEYAFC